MRKLLITVMMVGALATLAKAQQPNKPNRAEMKQKIEAARIALITERLNLSPDQAEKFWPVYNEFTSERKALREEFKPDKKALKAKEEMTEAERKEFLKRGLELKQKELDLEKEYSGKMLNVISTEQMLSLRGAEKDFKRMLLERVQRQRGQQMQRQQMRERQQQRQRRGN